MQAIWDQILNFLSQIITPDWGSLIALLALPQEPPPGVHAPVPSFQPILASIALAIILSGLVFGTPLLIVGIVTLTISLIGWLRDARAEYRIVEQADQTGHPVPPPGPA